MPLDPDIALMLARQEAGGYRGLAGLPPAHARAALRALTGVDRRDPADLPSVGSVEHLDLAPGIGARVYRPAAEGPVPTVVFLHGGGWVVGDLDTHDVPARLLCAEVQAVVVSVDYRLAPETRFPGAAEDALAATLAVIDRIGEFGGDDGSVVLAGDSAGANLAAVTALRLRDDGVPIAAQLLLYPAVDPAGDYPSRSENAVGYFLTDTDMRWFFDQYVGTDLTAEAAAALPSHPLLAPLRAADLSGVAPAVIATAEFDPLRDEGDAYADALRLAGVPVVHRRFPGLVHGFYGLPFPAAAAATSWAHASLRGMLEEDGPRR
jgi:acetyl esterase